MNMRLQHQTEEPNRLLQVLSGLILGLAALALLWFGLTSFLVAVAFIAFKGAWLPTVAGGGLFAVGVALLLKSLRCLNPPSQAY